MKQAEAELVTLFSEGVDLRLVLLDGLWEGLLGLAVLELAEVEGSSK